MRIVRTVAQLREAISDARTSGASIGMVPTMGALHEGHVSLLQRARAESDVVILSIFVNPTQFSEATDLDAYPRQEAKDADLAEDAGVDVIFAPTAAEVYPEGFATTVSVSGAITETLEGAGRGSSHFDGVATIVAKLLLAALPHRAYFGQKDAQQLRVVQRMVTDLGIPTEIVGCATSRDADGLARSSRNVRLSAEDRQRALTIPRALAAVSAAVAGGETEVAALRAAAESELERGRVVPEYLAFVDPDSFAPVETVRGAVLCAIAARVGKVRLIDNDLLTPPSIPTSKEN